MKRCSIFSPRNVCGTHGTGVQIGNFVDAFKPDVRAFNFGAPEPHRNDKAYRLESKIASDWPLKRFGRRFWFKLCERYGISFWREDALSRRGVEAIKHIGFEIADDRIIVVLATESDARRWNAIQEVIGLPFDVILYDLVVSRPPTSLTTPHLAEAICDADQVFAISDAIASAISGCGRLRTRRIGFYRQPPMYYDTMKQEFESKSLMPLSVLVLANAHPLAVSDLLETAGRLNEFSCRIDVHLVGDIRWSIINEARKPQWLHSHGRVSDVRRDEIASRCHIAYLAGPCDSPIICPYSRYSIPSKISDFIAFGLPIIARVAEGSAVTSLLRGDLSLIARVAHHRSSLLEHFEMLLREPGEIARMRSFAIEYARKTVILPNAAQAIFHESFVGCGSDPASKEQAFWSC